jgi:hypothetical protein
MLFDPESHQRFGNPAADCRQAVDPGMARSAESDKNPGFVYPRLAVMDNQPMGLFTDPAAEAVAGQNLFAQPGKVSLGMPELKVAGAAAAGEGGVLAAGAEGALGHRSSIPQDYR